ncbi:MAG: M28 family peptidase, partial [Chitinophagaceae bacterium]
MLRRFLFLMPFLATIITVFAQEKVDQEMINKIREQALNKSKVMDIALHLTDLNGNRLANSPGYKRAANYAVDFLASIGIENAHQESWGEFGKGWELEKVYFSMTSPYYKPILAFPKTWTAGTKGLKSADILVIDLKDSISIQAYKGKLKGKVLLPDMNYQYMHSFKADAIRYTDEELQKMANAPAAAARQQRDTAQIRRMREQMQRNMAPQRLLNILKNMAKEEGAIAVLSSSTRNHDGTIFAQGGGSYKASDPDNFLDLVLGVEDYNTLLRIAKNGIAVKVDTEVKTKFYSDDLNGYNVIGEIPGTDPALKDEVVMIGAHLDSWQTGTGATDNASGSSVMLEVMRILKALNIQPRRTIRIGL